MMNIHTLPTTTHGRYLVESPSGPVTGLLCGFHGYKENAESHLAVLRLIAAGRPWRLVSVQALHPFYAKGSDVVASWMTSQDRELAIADNIAYAAAVLSQVGSEYGAVRPVVYAGFSQGVAMAYRAAVFGDRPCDGLIVLAGDVPPDVVPVAARLPPTLLGRGTADDWYTAEKAAVDLATLHTAGTRVAEHVFDGGHVWHDGFISRAGEFLDERLERGTAL